ncbi:phosphoribosyltransferase family protein [Pseudomonas sp. Marseille-QA0892]
MNYRSVSDLARLVSQRASQLPRDIEVVVGIPRSGMLAASIIALKANLPLTDLYSFIRNDELKKGSTRSYKLAHLARPQEARKIPLVDDSVASGNSLKQALEDLRSVYAGEVVTLAAFVQNDSRSLVDLHLEVVPQPRVFEWNIMHHPCLANACFDIDGVLCVDPTSDENDDGPKYIEFLERTLPLVIPSVKVKHVVTSRLEKYRPQTEAWLARHGVQYERLHMIDLPTAAERRRLNMHHKHKAKVYRSDPQATLFVESEPRQALEIMRAANKPVYCTEDNVMYMPGMSLGTLQVKLEKKASSLGRKIKRLLGRPQPRQA